MDTFKIGFQAVNGCLPEPVTGNSNGGYFSIFKELCSENLGALCAIHRLKLKACRCSQQIWVCRYLRTCGYFQFFNLFLNDLTVLKIFLKLYIAFRIEINFVLL